MPLFNSQFGWRGIGATTVVELLILFILAFAVVGYVEWSSDAAVTEFMRATELSAPANSTSTPAVIFNLRAKLLGRNSSSAPCRDASGSSDDHMPSCASSAHRVRRDDFSHGGTGSTGVR